MTIKMEKIESKKYILECLTGLHIGAGKDTIEIGGNDNPVVKHPITREPYIPGSSLKGKLRALLEEKKGLTKEEEGEHLPCDCGNCEVCKLFGVGAGSENKNFPTRLIVRDSFLVKDKKNSEGESISLYDEMVEQGKDFYEQKTEVTIPRFGTGQANPRQLERVPAGAKFEVNISIKFYTGDDEKKLLATLEEGLALLQKDFLGGCGSRGCGYVKITEVK